MYFYSSPATNDTTFCLVVVYLKHFCSARSPCYDAVFAIAVFLYSYSEHLLNIKPHDQHIITLSIDFGHYRQESRLSGGSVIHEDDFAVDGVSRPGRLRQSRRDRLQRRPLLQLRRPPVYTRVQRRCHGD